MSFTIDPAGVPQETTATQLIRRAAVMLELHGGDETCRMLVGILFGRQVRTGIQSVEDSVRAEASIVSVLAEAALASGSFNTTESCAFAWHTGDKLGFSVTEAEDYLVVQAARRGLKFR